MELAHDRRLVAILDGLFVHVFLGNVPAEAHLNASVVQARTAAFFLLPGALFIACGWYRLAQRGHGATHATA